VRAALNSNYPNLRRDVDRRRIARPDFGSGEDSFRWRRSGRKVLILTKANAGQGCGAEFTDRTIFGMRAFWGIDAGYNHPSDAISRLVPHFINPKIGAIAGNAKVGNRVNLWTPLAGAGIHTSQNFDGALGCAGCGKRGSRSDWCVAGFRSAASGRLPNGYGCGRRRFDDGAFAARLPCGIRRHGAGIYRGADECEWPDAASGFRWFVRDLRRYTR